jgi:poly(3-hydroxybutyrate) depolymerase
MDKIADRDKFIIAYPNALPNDSNQQSWDMSGPNDFTFLMAIIDTVDKKYHIDRNRIYSCGFSQGGFMSFQLACRYSDIFAAIAPTSGLLTGTCKLKRPVSMRLTFGTNDIATPASFMQSVTTWLTLDSCPSTPVITRPYPSTNPNSVVTRLYYGPCAQGTEVVADSIRTGQHEWPMNTADRINNSEETWAFLKKFSLSSSAVVPRQTFLASRVGDCISATFCAGIVRMQGAGEKYQVHVFDTKGRLTATAAAKHSQFTFTDKPSGVYVVMVNGNEGPVAIRMVVP